MGPHTVSPKDMQNFNCYIPVVHKSKKKKNPREIKAEIWQMVEQVRMDSYSVTDHISKKYYFILSFKTYELKSQG